MPIRTKFLIISNLISFFLLLLSSHFVLGQPDSRGLKLSNQAEQFLLFSQHDSALIYFREAEQIFLRDQQWENYITTKNHIAECQSSLFELDGAMKTAKEAIELTDKYLGPIHVQRAVALENIGNVHYFIGQHALALEKFNEAEALLDQIPDETKHLHAAPANLGVGNVFFGTYQYEQAFAYFKNALNENISILGENHPYVANSYMSLANLYRNKGSNNLARENYERSLVVLKDYFGEIHPDIGTAYIGIGDILTGLGTYTLASSYYKQALAIYEQFINKNSPKYGDLYLSMAELYKNQGQYEKALEYYQLALDLYKNTIGENHQNSVRCNLGIGNTYVYMKRYLDALDYYNRVLEVNFNLVGENHVNTASVYSNLGSIYFFAGNFDLAMSYFQKALRIDLAIHGKDHPNVANSHYNIARIYGEKGETQLALDKIQDAINSSMIDFSDDNIFVNPALVNFFDTKDLLWYMRFKGELLATGFKTSGNLKGMDIAVNSFILSDSLIDQIRVSYTDRKDQIELSRLSHSIYSSAMDATYSLLELLTEENVKQIDPDADYEAKRLEYQDRLYFFSEKNKGAILFTAIAESNAKSFGGLPDSLLAKEIETKKHINEYTQELAAASDSSQKYLYQNLLFKANREYEFLIQKMEKNYPKYYDLKYDVSVTPLKNLQRFLDEKTMMVSYYLSSEYTYTCYISKNSFDVYREVIPDNYEKWMVAFRNALIYRSDYAFDFFGRLLYDQLFPEPIPEKFERLIIVEDGVMSSIPFEALPTGKVKNNKGKEVSTYLIEKYDISYCYSANLLYRIFQNEKIIQPKAPNELIAYAPVDFDPKLAKSRKNYHGESADIFETDNQQTTTLNLAPLPGTEKEVKSIAAKYDSSRSVIYMKKLANETRIKDGTLHDYKYVHLSSHAFVDEQNPEFSGILLTPDSLNQEDGILFTGEIYSMRINAELVNLSACETALGKIAHGEGIIGLARALMYAGAKNITVSLWKVDDTSTAQLMADYYDGFAKTKVPEALTQSLNYSASLRKAKLKMIEEGTYANPYYWSPFILIGK